jgi:dTDP-4-amino-4,6-dideoxygalactose transaminase
MISYDPDAQPSPVEPTCVTRLPPVRRAVPLRYRREARLDEHFPGFDVHVFRSGTDALAAALIDAKSRRSCARPEVILPAYGCPDLVSASLAAGVLPRLVDVEPDAWGYKLDELDGALSQQTAAIVAVDLLGVGDQAAELHARAARHGIPLIQDSAQHLPERSEGFWRGDYVVLSFGRGKPLNLLQGGALLTRAGRTAQVQAIGAQDRGSLRYKVASSVAAACAFNTITRPGVYGIAAHLPGLGVGETRFSPLPECTRLPASFGTRVAGAYGDYAKQESYRTGIWADVLARWAALGVRQLQCASESRRDTGQRLRLPLLAPSTDMRDHLVLSLTRAGCGASAMYERALHRITDVPEQVYSQGPFPGAAHLAGRFFTLPTHSLVDQAVVDKADAIIMRVARKL